MFNRVWRKCRDAYKGYWAKDATKDDFMESQYGEPLVEKERRDSA